MGGPNSTKNTLASVTYKFLEYFLCLKQSGLLEAEWDRNRYKQVIKPEPLPIV